MGLNLYKIPSGTNIFIDSNIFLYLFFKHPTYGKSCQEFIRRIEQMDIKGYVDEFVFNEVMHKLMVTALVNRDHRSPTEVIASVKDTPEILNELPELWQAGELLHAIDVTVISGPFFPEAVAFARMHRLLITDAVHVAAMHKEGIVHIATNDNDFSLVPSLQVWRPDRSQPSL